MCPKHLSLSLCPWFGQISSVNPIPYTWYDLVRWHTMLPGTLHPLPLIPWYLPSGVVPGCLSDGLLLAPPKLSLSSLEPEKCCVGFLDGLQTFMPIFGIMVCIQLSEADWNFLTCVALHPHITPVQSGKIFWKGTDERTWHIWNAKSINISKHVTWNLEPSEITKWFFSQDWLPWVDLQGKI